MPEKFTPEFSEPAVRMFFDREAAGWRPTCGLHPGLGRVAGLCGPETLHAWCTQAISAVNANPAAPTDESLSEENRRLRREHAEAQRANGILKKASALFAAELDRSKAR